MNEYCVGIDIGHNDGTIAMLIEIKENGIVYIIGEKATYMLGDDKITPKMLEDLKNLNINGRKKALKILGWDMYDAEVVIDR